jgi:hypothetical protein
MPYRTISIRDERGTTGTFTARISDAAVMAWLAERAGLRMQGYPDRPPDVDLPTHRAGIPRRGEEPLPYFAGGQRRSARDDSVFPVYTATWHAPGAITTKVIITGRGDGSIVSRVVVDHEAGERSVDKARIYEPDVDPETVWQEIETVVMAIDLSGMGWEAHSPVVADWADFMALEAEVEVAEAEALAAGLLAPMRVH